MSDKTQQKPTDLEISQERNRYFTGKYMTARDFKAEQDYFLSHQRSHIRMLHGWGVLCGLDVKKEDRSNCERWLTVNPGVAFDCFGREIDVKEEQRVWLPIPSRRPANAPTGTKYDSKDDEEANQHLSDKDGNATYEKIYDKPFFVCLQYSETYIDQVTALTSDNCDPAYKEANRVREGYTIVFKLKEKISGDQWKEQDRSSKTRHHNDCNKKAGEGSRSCLDVHCECDTVVVPIALITPFVDDDGYLIETPKDVPQEQKEEKESYYFKIETEGRYELPTPPEYLTHIIGINWPHGGKMPFSELKNKLQGRLIVEFDRKLKKQQVKKVKQGDKISFDIIEIDEDGDGDIDDVLVLVHERQDAEADIVTRAGINPYTFIVQFSGINQNLEFLPYQKGHPPQLMRQDHCKAVYEISQSILDESNLIGQRIYITLKCDFILDCHSKAVDGNHLGGLLPSGDGIAGGTFESWFYVGEG